MKALLIFIFALFAIAGKAQNKYAFKHLNVESGLSQSSVLSIAQDARGFMWFGTRLGLNKYDSKSFKVYYHEDNNKKSLSNASFLSSILALKDGTLLIGTSQGLNKYNEGDDNFDHYTHNNKDPNSLSNSVINCIFQDKKNRVWIGTTNGLNLLSTNGKFKHFLYEQKQPQQIYAITEDHNGTLWLSTTYGLINMSFKEGKIHFRYFKDFSEELSKAIDNHITSMVEDRENNLWIGTKQTGVSKLNLSTETITAYQYSSLNTTGISSNNVRKIMMDEEGKLWIGTLHGINIYNPATKNFSSLHNIPEDPTSLSQNSVYDIYRDRQGIIWVGTYYGAINMVYPNYTPFKLYRSTTAPNGLSSNVVSSIMEDQHQNLWIGTEGEGLNYYDRKNDTFTRYKNNPNDPKSLSANLVKSVIRDKKNRIWVGTHYGGLNLFQPETKTFVRYTKHKNDTSSISSDEITAVFEDSYGRFWVGTNSGLNSFNSTTGKFIRNRVNGSTDAVIYIFEDAKQNLWVAINSGLYQLKKDSQRFVRRVAANPEILKYNEISCLTADKEGYLLMGTSRNGLFRLNPDRHSYTRITTFDGLPSNTIMGILEDDFNNLWITTDKGLCKYNPRQKTFKTYNIKDGLPGNEFNYKSFLKDSKGEFFFGGLSGMVSFFPSEIKENKNTPPVIFTGLKLFNKPIALNTEDGLLKQNISTVKSITFEADQNVFSIDFTLLNFIKSDKNHYAYKLEGFEKNWNYVDNPSASYTNLSPGNYTLMVKGSNNDGLWTNKTSTLNINILPPFYKTWWAYLFYFCAFAAISFLFIRYLLIKAVFKKEKEINEHKLEFFTNISHEIRTPLTLIVGPLDKLIENAKDDPALNRELQPIKNNADRLMNLVTELLDFRKAESGKMALHISPGDVVRFCREIFLAFQNMAISKNIDYQFETGQAEIELYFDKVQMEKVMFNLLSNAFKFTPVNGKISLKIEVEKQLVNIKVRDNGKGIALENQANLFTNFYQANTNTTIGTGLGLSLSKSIVALHHGEITFESTPQSENQHGATCFTLSLKTGKTHFKPADFVKDYVYYDDATNYELPTATELQQAPETEAVVSLAAKKYSILLVEDNEDVRAFIKNALGNIYIIYESANGAKGLEMALEVIPDLIISDVMMPIMDGLELCRKLKTDERTSHIPVILLTARSAYVHQVNGFENGADAYIMKPFNLKILELNIQNLLNARETIKQKFAQVVTLEPRNMVINTTEQNFLNKIIQIIEDRMADTAFDVPTLAAEIGMSQPVLYKKIRALTDLSVNDFIKSIRIKRAAQLLKQGVGNISEIAYSVGFSDRKYFSSEFKKHFGKTPSEFMNND
ncbi:ligand-binding sensor domain-containing protein/signal transduction histidine kinase/DNA-binding response OmpR family regulator [Pedobacter sp. AK013]|uniref:hybrid sensor histidine kinase/response regulator transcription factor n=1 Tax=Pedobacter sp. AK013 TaxID=2723071 RepID=UPI001617E069|nr:two-component regulator propeller domain-containing protein [Pedobacter sp. AK013]MBB6236789.1 ligand-binding sensor domain-containing protein/signal transduction histidine kinase/DNA-binding response OmpR family regulator [Pedobacter sp. AK013]